MRALLASLLLASVAAATEPPSAWLVIDPADARGRRPFNPDRIFARYLLDPAAPAPREGETVGEQAWRKVAPEPDGSVAGAFAYAYAEITSPVARVALARLPGAATLFVNGDAFAGDVYGLGNDGVPVLLREGANRIFVRGVRGRFLLELGEVPEGLHVAAGDATLPHLVAGAGASVESAGVVLLNASSRAVLAAEITAAVPGAPGASLEVGPIPPLGVRKAEISFPVPEGVAGEVHLGVAVAGREPRLFPLGVRERAEPRRRTFLSRIDGSVQEYSVVPPTGDPAAAGIVLSLHGAGVDALNQARSYAPKEDFWILAPTNRRPFGFDWQDWGRLDAYEALDHLLAMTPTAGGRVFLTGHSMGGHGAWHLAANDPDRFRAVAPSAGWCSFDTYAGGRPAGRLDALWKGADRASLTLDLVANLVGIPIFILHGVDDDNVPLSEARRMEEAILAAGGGFTLHYEKGAGHWWDRSDSPGADCVDWPGIFDLFRGVPPRGAPRDLEFTTADPGIDADHHGVRIEQPLVYGEASRVRLSTRDDGTEVTTANVRRLRLPATGTPLKLDGTAFPAGGERWFVRRGDAWVEEAPVAGEKGPSFCGPFKRAFDNRFVLVYGSGDTEGLARARYDAQAWWYRGNGDAPVLSDEEFASSGLDRCNVILYGNATVNSAFASVLPEGCPIRVLEGAIEIGDRAFRGAGLGCLFVYPRRDAPGALVGVFGSTGPAGARLGYTLLPFLSGVGYPDYAVFSEAILEGGDEGVLAAGWLDHGWALPAEAQR